MARRAENTDCHTSDIGHWFAMTILVSAAVEPRGIGDADPYGMN